MTLKYIQPLKGHRTLKIVVADDEIQGTTYYLHALTKIGHKVLACANTGEKLIEEVLNRKPDLVITDIKMPEMDGLTAAKKIYEINPIPIIIVSGFHDDQLLEKAEENHIAAYLVKPVRIPDLQSAIILAYNQFEKSFKNSADYRLITEATKILMKKRHIDEKEAHKTLKDLAQKSHSNLVSVSRTIVALQETIQFNLN